MIQKKYFVLSTIIIFGLIIVLIVIRKKNRLGEFTKIRVDGREYVVGSISLEKPWNFTSNVDFYDNTLENWQISILLGKSNYSKHLDQMQILSCYEIGRSHKKLALDQARYISERFGSINPPINYSVSSVVLVKAKCKAINLVLKLDSQNGELWTSLVWSDSSWKLQSPAITKRRGLEEKMEPLENIITSLAADHVIASISMTHLAAATSKMSNIEFSDVEVR